MSNESVAKEPTWAQEGALGQKNILPLIEIRTRKLHCYQTQELFFQKFFVVPIQDEYDSQQNRIGGDRSLSCNLIIIIL